MKILRAYDFSNNDCTMDTECEHCGYVCKDKDAYNDHNYIYNVVPGRYCPHCHLKTNGEVNPKPMIAYQIQFTDKDGCGSFGYFKINGDPYDMAASEATEYMNNRIDSIRFGRYSPVKTPTVVEFDLMTKEPKKKGLKFKLKLTKTVLKFSSGRVETSYYYYAVLPKVKTIISTQK